MRFVSTAAQSRELDRRVIEGLQLPGIALMELAARGVADAILAHHADAARRGTVVACGPGNNGGDGYAVARWLKGWGLPVSVVALGLPRAGSDAELMAECARAAGVDVLDAVEGAPGLWVDALFGTGLGRDLNAEARALVQAMRGSPVVAVDLPSGLDSDTGHVWGACPQAATTVTFGRPKLGMFCGEGPARCGRVVVVDIGLGAGTPRDGLATAEIPDAADLAPLWPRRGPLDHKGRSGHLLIVAGSAPMAGAAVLACRGALAAGAALVTLAAPRGAFGRLAGLPPEVMVLPSGEGDLTEGVPTFDRATALLVGPGLAGGGALAPQLASSLAAVWHADPRPAVFDADALPATGPTPHAARRVLTPHPGEAARLLQASTREVAADRFDAARALSDRGVTLLKGRPTMVASAGGRPSINPTGNEVLAVGGSGDVLAGVIGGLLARSVDARDAARLGAWVHGAAADALRARRSQGWRASDVADALPDAIEALIAEPGA
ncbi:MAG: NAD(P)H-hydrate dehydratase [Alphaproteobacteria bacterium]|nr:NAD(P)H-hydrate dehydratase [Alphaproteobacteria bacterium]MCB9699489.1 NAD(P)H-hydrate dehydratase [Alphaproteobacteria bacterium]